MIVPEFFQITLTHVKGHICLCKKDIGKWVFSFCDGEFVGFTKSRQEIEDYFFSNRRAILRSRNMTRENNA